MDIKRIFKKDFIIGLDIGSDSVKLAQFTEKEGSLRLVRSALREINEKQQGPARDKEIASILKDLSRGIDTKKSKVIVSINCPLTAIKKLTVPYMPKAELHDGIKLEARNYFPFPIDNSSLDFEILGDVVDKGLRKYEVVVAVSAQATVERHLSMLKAAGLKPSSFIPSPYALKKSIEHIEAIKDKKVCIIDIGKVNTELVIAKGEQLLFARKIPVAGDTFTKGMTGALVSDRGKTQLDFPEAEKIKKEIGIPDEADTRIIDDKISTAQILSMMIASVEQLKNEIDRCLDYYREESGAGVDLILLSGRGAALRGIIKRLSEELSIEVRLIDPLEGLDIDKDTQAQRGQLSYCLSIAVGAALSQAKGINLLPVEIKQEKKIFIKRGAIEAIATAVIVILALTYTGMRIHLANIEKKIAASGMELKSLGPELEKAKLYHAAKALLADEPNWEDILKELSNVIPKEIHLRDFRMKDGVIIMEGVAISEHGEAAISDFILTLEKGIFKNVKLLKSEDLPDKKGNEFMLRCWAE